MQIKTTYKGTLNGVHGVWCGFCPKDIIIEEEIPIYYPAENKIFKKGTVYFNTVILNKNEKIEDYEEVDIPEEESSSDNNDWKDLPEASNETTIE